MLQGARLYFVALYAIGPVVALFALRGRRSQPRAAEDRVKGWRWHVPTVLLPIEWLLPPGFILLGIGELQAEWLLVRLLGFAVSLCGAIVLLWASATLGRFLVHEATVFQDHALVTRGPYRFVRHPIYSGYLALLLGSGIGMLNVCLLLLWPLSFLGILVQAGSEELLLGSKFADLYQGYAGRTGRWLPRVWGRAR